MNYTLNSLKITPTDPAANNLMWNSLAGANYIRSALPNDCGLQKTIKTISHLKRYAVIHTGRCGSTYIHSYIRACGIAPPHEIFSELSIERLKNQTIQHLKAQQGKTDDQCSLDEYLDYFPRYSLGQKLGQENTFLGVAITLGQLLMLKQMEVDKEFLSTFSKNLTLFLLRRNILKQAISYVVAIDRGFFHSHEKPKGNSLSESESWQELSEERRKRLISDVLKFLDFLLWQESNLPLFVDSVSTNHKLFFYEDIIDSPEIFVFPFIQDGAIRRDNIFGKSSTPVKKVPSQLGDKLYEHYIELLLSNGDVRLASGRRFTLSELEQRISNTISAQ